MSIEPLRKILPYTTIAVMLALLYTGYTFYSRDDEQTRLERAATQREAERGRDSLDRVGGGTLKILQFYATRAAVAHGQTAQLCYSVVFAKKVRIEPETEAIWPSMGHCIDVKVSQTTHYTLTADDGQGHTATKSTDVALQ